jgi:hypothetical protein
MGERHVACQPQMHGVMSSGMGSKEDGSMPISAFQPARRLDIEEYWKAGLPMKKTPSLATGGPCVKTKDLKKENFAAHTDQCIVL